MPEPTAATVCTQVLDAAAFGDLLQHADGNTHIDATTEVAAADRAGLIELDDDGAWRLTGAGVREWGIRLAAAPYALLAPMQVAQLVFAAMAWDATDKASALHGVWFHYNPLAEGGTIAITVEPPHASAKAARAAAERIVATFARTDVVVEVHPIGRLRHLWRRTLSRTRIR
jgi:hypothetical protein